MEKKLPNLCPSCAHLLSVSTLTCSNCETVVSGSFDLPVLSRFSAEEQDFILDFVKSSGSLKLMAKKLNLSYPTVRNRLDDLIATIETHTSS